jgi:hypothetical protein
VTKKFLVYGYTDPHEHNPDKWSNEAKTFTYYAPEIYLNITPPPQLNYCLTTDSFFEALKPQFRHGNEKEY